MINCHFTRCGLALTSVLKVSRTLLAPQFNTIRSNHPIFVDPFEMAIHQHMVSYAKNANIETSNLRDLLQMISAITNFKIDAVTLVSTLTVMMQKLTEVPVPREAENIQAMNLDSVRIIEFFRNLGKDRRDGDLTIFVLKKVYESITKESEVSPLICLGLAVIPENHIHDAVKYILNESRYDTNQHQSIMRATKRLIAWQKMTCFKVPLHIWIVRVLSALHDEKAYSTLHEIILENIELCFLTLLLPAFQIRTFTGESSTISLLYSFYNFAYVFSCASNAGSSTIAGYS